MKKKMTKTQERAIVIKNRLNTFDTGMLLRFRWGVSRGYETAGYNVCSCLIDGEKVGMCKGGGYDMQGTAFSEFLNNAYSQELKKLYDSGFREYGLECYRDRVYVDGGCGLNEMIRIFKALGYSADYKWNKRDGVMYYIYRTK